MTTIFISLILLLALVAIRISNKSGLPELLLFLGLGIFFSAKGMEFKDYALADQMASLSLMVIMFYGGFGTNWSMGKNVAKESIILSSLGVFFTAFLTGAFCHFVLKMDFLESMLLGSVVGSTDYASVSNILVSKNLNLKYNTASLLEIESGSNDPTAYTMTMVFLALLAGTELFVPLLIFKQVVFGLGLGFLMAWIFFKVIAVFHFEEDGLFSVFIAALMFGTYGLSNYLGGNGYLSIYVLGILMGDQEYVGKRDLVFFYDGVSSLVQIALFFLLGLMSKPALIVKALPLGLAIMVFMLLVARPLTVFGLMAPFKLRKNQKALISFAGIRGAAAIAFAIMAINSKVPLDMDLFHIIFAICLFSALIQGSLMPLVTKKLQMFDPNDTVLKTFNYYQDKSRLGFVQTRILDQSPWVGQKIKDVKMVFNFIIAKIERNGETIIPRGETKLKAGDLVVLGGETHFDKSGQNLLEITLSPHHHWVGKKIQDLHLDKNELIIMLQAEDGEIIVPSGEILLKAGDRLVLIQTHDIKKARDRGKSA